MALSISQSRSCRIVNGTMLEHPLSFSPYERKKQFIDQTNLIRKLHLLPFFYIFYLLIILIKWIICFINLNKVVFLFIRLKRFCWIKRCFPCLRSLRSTNESFSKESCIFFLNKTILQYLVLKLKILHQHFCSGNCCQFAKRISCEYWP